MKLTKNNAILAICEMGLVRSASFVEILKLDRGYKNILNCGLHVVHEDTLAMLVHWADQVFVTADRSIWREFPDTYKSKAKFVEYGKDIWHDSDNPTLKQLSRKFVEELGL